MVGANPGGFNRYTYVLNNPMMYDDPMGHDVGFAGRDPSKESEEWVEERAREKEEREYKELVQYGAAAQRYDPTFFSGVAPIGRGGIEGVVNIGGSPEIGISTPGWSFGTTVSEPLDSAIMATVPLFVRW